MISRLPWLLAGLLFAATALAQTSLEALTSDELRDAIRSGKTTVLVPIGGTEWNDSHIVLGKHNVRARILAEGIAVRLGNALVAPVIAYVPEGGIDPPTAHMRHPGTITIPEDAFEKTLESAARSFQGHGFTAVVLLGDHGGYRKSLARVADRLNRGRSRPAVLVPAEYYREMEHAGAEDTALTLAVDPRLVRDPKGASAERGKVAMEQVLERTTEAIRRATAR